MRWTPFSSWSMQCYCLLSSKINNLLLYHALVICNRCCKYLLLNIVGSSFDNTMSWLREAYTSYFKYPVITEYLLLYAVLFGPFLDRFLFGDYLNEVHFALCTCILFIIILSLVVAFSNKMWLSIIIDLYGIECHKRYLQIMEKWWWLCCNLRCSYVIHTSSIYILAVKILKWFPILHGTNSV